MGRFRVGCTGWGYDDWRGGFYPPGTPPGEYLARYARAFDLTEVDSSYYQAPSREQAARWAAATPPGFTFSVKFPGAITHRAALRGVEDATDAFLAALAPLRVTRKLGPLVLQLPASFTRERGEEALAAFLARFPRDQPLGVELRHDSWWRPETYRMLERAGATLVWSSTESGRTPPVLTAGMAYVRVIGDRQLTRFDRIQRDPAPELRWWRDRLEDEGSAAREAWVLVNNHLAGFAPRTAVLAQEILGLPPADLGAAKREGGQASLDLF